MKFNYRIESSLMLTLVFLLLACSSNRENTNDSIEEYELVLNDSIVIENLSRIQLFSYIESENQFLGFSREEELIVIVDENGQILKKQDLKGNSPNSYGYTINNLGIVDELYCIVNDNNILFYDSTFNLVKKFKNEPNMYVQSPSPFGGTPYVGDIESGKLLLVPNFSLDFVPESETSLTKVIEYFDFADLKHGGSFDFSVYKDGLSSVFYDMMTPVVAVDRNNSFIYLSNPVFDRLWVLDGTDFSLKNTFELDLPFKDNKSLPLDVPHGSEERVNQFLDTKRIFNIIPISSDMFGIVYYEGMDTENKSLAKEVGLSNNILYNLGNFKCVVYRDGVAVKKLLWPNGKFICFTGANDFLFEFPENFIKEEESTKYYIYEFPSNM